MIFGTVSGQSLTGFRLGFDPESDVFGFFCVFWYHSNSMTNHERTKSCLVLYGSEIWVILCVKIILICACVMC